MERVTYPIEFDPGFQPFDPKTALIGRDMQLVVDSEKATRSLLGLNREQILSIAQETFSAHQSHQSPPNQAVNVIEYMYEKGVKMFEQILTPDELTDIKKKIDAPDVYGDNIMRLGWH